MENPQKQRTNRPLHTENNQQQPSGDNWRQNERQMHKRIEHAPARKPAACEQHGGENGKRQTGTDCTSGHA
jgi:hypothetical protein